MDYLSTAVFIAISAWARHAVRQEIRGFQEAAEARQNAPGWHPVKHGGILP
ncbi:hypothetical protein NYV48_26955 [Escherichia coli]|nr:hypothetical protein [Escherichia coli]